MMTDRPIILKSHEATAINDGRQTQIRRPLIPQPPSWIYPDDNPGYSALTPSGYIEFRGRYIDNDGVDHGPASKFIKLPYLKRDRLWAKEKFDFKNGIYAADNPAYGGPWCPAIFMQKDASRLTLQVTDVRVQRLQDISEDDARAEGAPPSHPSIDYISQGFGYQDFSRSWFAQTWDSINKKRGHKWDDNPWVVAITFDIHKINIERIGI